MTDLELTIKYFQMEIGLSQISKKKGVSGMAAYSFLVKTLLKAVHNGEVGITKIKGRNRAG